MSGKGGVGKTTISINLASLLSSLNYKTGLMDADIHGPNVPKMLGIENEKVVIEDQGIIPIELNKNFVVMSIAFSMRPDKSLIWRGPLKHKILKQFVEDVQWGKLDFLIVDLPPGTGDEQISVSQLLNPVTGVIIISTPQKVAILDAIKSIDFARAMNIPIIGIVENMSGVLFGSGTIHAVAKEHNIPFLGTLSANEKIVQASDEGKPFVFEQGNSKKELNAILDKVISFCEVKK